MEFKYFPHGFLSYDYSFIMPQVEECIQRICKDIESFDNILSLQYLIIFYITVKAGDIY